MVVSGADLSKAPGLEKHIRDDVIMTILGRLGTTNQRGNPATEIQLGGRVRHRHQDESQNIEAAKIGHVRGNGYQSKTTDRRNGVG